MKNKYVIQTLGDWKKFRSENYNYDFNLKTGFFARWGKTQDDDPEYSPFGAELLDFEISTICKGIHTKNGSSCADYCYKMNSSNGLNISYNDFVQVVEKINRNNQLTQIAFGLGATAEENPDIWRMCEYLRNNYIIPNGTVADITDETADKIAKWFGACAVSYHGDFDIFANSVKRLTDRGMDQVNCHLVYYEENYNEVLSFLEKITVDERVSKLNAVVLLALKKKGWAEVNNLTPMSQDKFNNLIDFCFNNKINIGMDSCSAHRFIQYVNTNIHDEKQKQLMLLSVEPCESFGIFSSYVNVKGEYSFCSFCENVTPSFNVLTCNDFITDIWNSEEVSKWRNKSLSCNRKCIMFDV